MRLHIGASRDQIQLPQTKWLRTGPWIHLGAPESIEESGASYNDGYLSFHYRQYDRLPFEDNQFTFAYSEHFFEHLFLDEACELFKECFRVLHPGACLRVVVPDADLRTYMAPEPVGYTTGDDRWFHPDKHKTRWSFYSLSYLLGQVGFFAHGVVYCDKFGLYHRTFPNPEHRVYRECLDRELVLDTAYVLRYDHSLVVDAFKPR